MRENWKDDVSPDFNDTVRAQALTEILRITLPPMLAAHPRAEVLKNELRLQLARWRAEDTPISKYQAQVLLQVLQGAGDTLA